MPYGLERVHVHGGLSVRECLTRSDDVVERSDDCTEPPRLVSFSNVAKMVEWAFHVLRVLGTCNIWLVDANISLCGWAIIFFLLKKVMLGI